MAALVILGLLSVAWTAYELGRNARPAGTAAQAWDSSGRPVRVIEVLEPERTPRRASRSS
jgi:hypothetical protein